MRAVVFKPEGDSQISVKGIQNLFPLFGFHEKQHEAAATGTQQLAADRASVAGAPIC